MHLFGLKMYHSVHFNFPSHKILGNNFLEKFTICFVKNYMSRLMGKPTICIGENKDADQLRGNREADQRLCFRYSDSTIPLLSKSKISSLWPSSVTVQAGLCRACSETTLLVFPRGSSYDCESDMMHCIMECISYLKFLISSFLLGKNISFTDYNTVRMYST